MAEPGSYQWWRDNYKTDTTFQGICAILKKKGIDCDEVEVDHFPPNASYSGSKFDSLPYAARPAFPLPKYIHRFHRGDGGMGGHASTTGSTFVAKEWTGELKTTMKSGDFYSAMKTEIIDKKNLALACSEDRTLFNPILAPAVILAYKLGYLAESEYYDLLNDVGSFGK